MRFRPQTQGASKPAARLLAMVGLISLVFDLDLAATSIIPISDQGLYRRADVIVHGIVVSSDVTVDEAGRPETLSVIEPLSVLKGRLSGSLVLHQLGGTLPDGRFLKLWGRPEYVPGREVIVFAIARPEGEYQTAEMLLGKFEIWRDQSGNRFALSDLAVGIHPGVDVYRDEHELSLGLTAESAQTEEQKHPRDLDRFLAFLREGASSANALLGSPVGKLESVHHSTDRSGRVIPLWGNINDFLWRWNNGATAIWTLEGTANMTGGGVTEATNALAAWTSYPNATINYTVGSGTLTFVHLNAPSSPCGWSTCFPGSGTIGCGGPSGGGSHSWRGDSYFTITGGEVWLRCYSTFNQVSSITTQSVLEHELGHTLGLGHSDQNVSPHDVCRGDEGAAIMRSSVQAYTALGTDDQDAIRWIYGDGFNSCGPPPAPTVTSVSPTFGSTAGGTQATILGLNFQAGAGVAFGGAAATGVTVVNSTIITASSPAHSAGTVDVVVTNPDTQTGTLSNGFTYNSGVGFFTVTPCRVADTRNPNGPLGGPALVAGASRSFVLAGQCGIPVGARSVSINVTVTQPTALGDLRLYPGGTPIPLTSAINYQAGQTRANNAVVPLGAGGDVGIQCDQTSGTVHGIIDVNGYFQ